MTTSSRVLEWPILDSETAFDAGDFCITAESLAIDSKVPIRIEQTTLAGGKQQGVRLLTLSVGEMTVRVVPCRGMAVLDVVQGDTRFGWDSPVSEVVNPAFINQEASGGLGWLDGFNEMLVRCGYQWAGHPGQDGDEFLTLHGRIQNTPASRVMLRIERDAPYRVTLSGRVDEKRFKFTNFEVWMHLSIVPGEPYLNVQDSLTNRGVYAREYQVIYHNNFGAPVLEAGGRLHVPVAELSPFNDYAAKGLSDWNQIPAPTRDFDERVFNVRPLSDEQGETRSLLHNADASLGIEVAYQADTLPVLTIWKNTDLPGQGYVMGIEPGTSFAYNRRYQRPLGLVPSIQPGETVQFSLRFGFLTTPETVSASLHQIQALQGDTLPAVKPQPLVKLPA